MNLLLKQGYYVYSAVDVERASSYESLYKELSDYKVPYQRSARILRE